MPKGTVRLHRVLRAKMGARNTAYLVPEHGSFLVGLVLGDHAMETALSLDLSPAVADVTGDEERYGEETGFRLPVEGTADLADIKQLIQARVNR